LPAGTVTMLFSDIEGSTALLSRLGNRYGEALSVHRAVLRQAIAAWGGREMSTEGDSFFVVFGSAADAVGCALAAQRGLATCALSARPRELPVARSQARAPRSAGSPRRMSRTLVLVCL
jgi:class 3 adenylate cyclase